MGKTKRSISDKIITKFDDLRYGMYEPIRLNVERKQHERQYEKTAGSPLVSVYTPTYNRGEILIERAVKSVLAQTYDNFEYVIIGDCCTDNTEKLVSQIKDPRIRFYNMKTKSAGYPLTPEGRWLAGPVKAANKALDMIRGDWIARLDDDDTFTTDHIELLLSFAKDGNYEFVSALYEEERFGEKKVVEGVRAEDPYYTRKPAKPYDDSPLIGGTSTWLYRSYLKYIKYNINCWRKDWNRVNDVDLSLRIYKAGTRMGFMDKVVTHVYPRPGEETVGLDAYLEAEKRGIEVHN